MKMPKERKRYCPKCKKVTLNKISQNKSGGKRNAYNEGTRRFEAKRKGYGSFPRKKPENSKRWGIKQSKKMDLRFTCKECGKAQGIKTAPRMKKIEWVSSK
jgi:large subunit ribosomal protein L44e